MAIESLAVLPVVSSLVFIFRSPGLSYQEVNIALIGKEINYTLLGIAASLNSNSFTPFKDIRAGAQRKSSRDISK
jgi:hypothetical protein